MKLFGKKKETTSCCCEGNGTLEAIQDAESKKQEKGMKILGSGCAKCMELEKAARRAIAELELECDITHVTDFAEIASYGVMSTPALVLDGKVLSYGRVLSVEEVKALLTKQ